jgi:hypothetical protein
LIGHLDVGTLTLPSVETAPVIVTNHSSRFFFVSSTYNCQPDAHAKFFERGFTTKDRVQA